MTSTQSDFIQLALDNQVLLFGDFTLKSGRKSPYFFNAGRFQSGAALQKLGDFYAQAVHSAGVAFDTLFGPAYKGIPLVSATSIAFAQRYGLDLPYCFNRKEAKAHGEGGQIVGAPLAGKVLIVDDVITAGTAIREAMSFIEQANASPAGIVVALDRQERGQGGRSAIQEVEAEYKIPVIRIISLNDIIDHLANSDAAPEQLSSVKAYRDTYGV